MSEIHCQLDKVNDLQMLSNWEPSSNKFADVATGRIIRVKDRTFQPILTDPWQHIVEEMYRVQVCYDTGETKQWSFDSLEWWTRENGASHIYQMILASAIAFNQKIKMIMENSIFYQPGTKA